MHNLTTSTKEYKDILKDLTDKEYGQATSIKILTSIFGLLFIIGIILSFSIGIGYLSDLAMRGIISDGLVISAPILFTLAGFSFLAFVSYYTNMPGTGGWDMSMYDNYTALDSLIREDSYSIGDALEKVEKTYIFVRRIISLRNRSYLFNDKTQEIILELSEQTPVIMLEILKSIEKEIIHRINDEKEKLNHAQNQIMQVESTKENSDDVLALQQARLDKQIEQFEELQRVLVKA